MRLVFFGLLFVLSSLGAAPYVQEPWGFSIEFPEGWRVEEDRHQALFIACAPGEGVESISILVEEIPQGMTLEEYYSEGVKELEQSVEAFHIEEAGTSELGGKRAKWILLTGCVGGEALKSLQTFTIVQKRLYIVTCTALPSTYARYQPLFQDSLHSLYFSESGGKLSWLFPRKTLSRK